MADLLELVFWSIPEYLNGRIQEIWKTLGKNNLWKRMIKNTLATTTTVILSLVHTPNLPFGKAAYLAAMISVFAHPGRRFGQLTEVLILALGGSLIGIAWSALGIYLGSLFILSNPSAGYAIRGVFLAVALGVHGYIRSYAPRLWTFVLLLIIVCITALTGTSTNLTTIVITQILYPILMGVGVILIVNISVFPEFSSSFLGRTTIETLEESHRALADACQYFLKTSDVAPEGTRTPDQTSSTKENKLEGKFHVSLNDITSVKSKLRKKLSSCQSAQSECQFELAYSVLPPRYMGPISKHAMRKFVASTIALIGACESRFALLGEDIQKASTGDGTNAGGTRHSLKGVQIRDLTEINLALVKPKKEIEFGDVEFLRHLLKRIELPFKYLKEAVDATVEIVKGCLAFAYDATGALSTSSIGVVSIEELDAHSEVLQQALRKFDFDCADALDGITEYQALDSQLPDVMPREELFLVSSFLLNFRQAAVQIADMLSHCRDLLIKRHERQNRRRLYAPKILWARWLYSGGEEQEALPASGRKAARQGTSDDHGDEDFEHDAFGVDLNSTGGRNADLEATGRNSGFQPMKSDLKQVPEAESLKEQTSTSGKRLLPILRIRRLLADAVEWIQDSEDLTYALKLTIAGFLVSFPAFVPDLNSFYSLDRGAWATLQLVFVFEVAIGTSISSFIIRAVGTTMGALWGWAAYESRLGDPFVCTAMIIVGLIPSTYVQLGSKYPKAGMVAIVSISVVALSSELASTPGSGTENFLKRWIAFMIGGMVALLVEVTVMPVKARSRMVESLAAAVTKISEMEGCIAYGADQGKELATVFPPEVYLHFERASGNAKTAISAAETFLPFCNSELRLKGSFSGLALIYREIIFVLHQITERMENMLQLRTAYGSGPLEEFNSVLYPYRRNIAGSITLTLYAINEALTLKLPLPQFLPSARLAHLRLINKVREVTYSRMGEGNHQQNLRSNRRRYMSWNATSAALAEIIEYLEELVDLNKLLVGANEFRSGLLMRPTYGDYVGTIDGADDRAQIGEGTESPNTVKPTVGPGDLIKRRSPILNPDGKGNIPPSLKRIQTRARMRASSGA